MKLKPDQLPLIAAMIKNEAHNKREDAIFSGAMHDNGASGIINELEFYEAGVSGEIPKKWEKYVKELDNIADPDYETYLKLKKKFEGKK